MPRPDELIKHQPAYCIQINVDFRVFNNPDMFTIIDGVIKTLIPYIGVFNLSGFYGGVYLSFYFVIKLRQLKAVRYFRSLVIVC